MQADLSLFCLHMAVIAVGKRRIQINICLILPQKNVFPMGTHNIHFSGQIRKKKNILIGKNYFKPLKF